MAHYWLNGLSDIKIPKLKGYERKLFKLNMQIIELLQISLLFEKVFFKIKDVVEISLNKKK